MRTKITCLAVFIFMNYDYGFSQLSGVYTVGSFGGENYSSITNAGGFFDDVNTNGLSGNVTLQITTNLVGETGNINLNAFSGGFSISIVPQSASVKTITAVDCSNNLILFNGADNVTIDGSFSGSGHYLKFISSCNDKSVIKLKNDCENITIKNTIIFSDNDQSSVATGGAIHVDDIQTNGCDNLQIINNKIGDFSGPIDLFDAIQVNAPNTGGGNLTGLVIANNEINNTNGKGIFIIDNVGEINQAQILGNSFFGTGTITGPGVGWAYAIVQIESGSGHIIRGNYFGGQGPKCVGGKMDIQLTSGSNQISLIRMKIELPNATINDIDSNVFKSISLVNGSSDYMSASLIRLESGNNNVGVNEGNIVGDLVTDATIPANASIYVESTDVTNSSTFNFVRASTTGSVNVEKNKVGSIMLNNTINTALKTYLFYSDGSSVNFNNNIVGGVTNNIVKSSDGRFRVFYSDMDNSAFTISGNTISGITTDDNFSDYFNGIYVTSGTGSPTISNNAITNINIVGTNSTPRFYGIRSDNPNTFVTDNTISGINFDSKYTTQQWFGIYCDISNNMASISGNLISDVRLKNLTDDVAAIGIYTSSGSSDYTIKNNFLDKFEIYSSSTSCYFRMIYINSANSVTLTNNVILVDNNNRDADFYIYGIYDNNSNSGGSSTIWHNTIDIRGTCLGTRRSACYYKSSGASRNVQNNIFNNRRTRNSGSGSNYAMYFASSSDPLVCDYNLLYNEDDPNELVYYSGNKNFSGWQSNGNGSNSIVGFAPQNLVDFNTGKQTTFLGNDVGNSSLGINIDHDNNSRPLDLGYDMGAFEAMNNTLAQPLPVSLLGFRATCEQNESVLKWTTASEINNDYFTIYQSTDASNWEKIANVIGAGNSNQVLNYSYHIQNQDLSKWKYFKLAQTDFDGNSKEFNTVVTNCSQELDNCFSVFPNPSNGEYLSIEFFDCLKNNTVDILIKDIVGRTAFYRKINQVDQSVFPLELEEVLSAGTYFVTVSTLNSNSTNKIIVR